MEDSTEREAQAANSNGTIYRMTTAGTNVTALHHINNNTEGANGTGGNGVDSENLLLQATDGKFYGANFGGGIGNQGNIHQLTSAGVFSWFILDGTTKPNFGTNPSAPLMQHTNGTIFGTNTGWGPSGAAGTFFSLNIGASPFIRLVSPVPGGNEGSQIGILGQGFRTSSVVKFGGVTATTKALTGNTFILATVPAGAPTGNVTVTTSTTTLTRPVERDLGRRLQPRPGDRHYSHDWRNQTFKVKPTLKPLAGGKLRSP